MSQSFFSTIQIEGFFTTIQEDIIVVGDSIRGKAPINEEQNKKVAFAAGRIFAAIGMGIGFILAVSAVPSFTAAPIGTLFKMALGAAIYALNHDVFIMAKNSSDQMSLLPAAAAVGKSIFDDIVDFVKGKKDVDQAPRQAITENTIFRPLWDAAMSKIPSSP